MESVTTSAPKEIYLYYNVYVKNTIKHWASVYTKKIKIQYSNISKIVKTIVHCISFM